MNGKKVESDTTRELREMINAAISELNRGRKSENVLDTLLVKMEEIISKLKRERVEENKIDVQMFSVDENKKIDLIRFTIDDPNQYGYILSMIANTSDHMEWIKEEIAIDHT